MRELDTQEYVSMLKELVEEGHQVSLLISGSSMLPFLIHHRDTIYFQKPDRELKVGDMVFYRRSNGKYVMHRICRIRPEGFYMVGDAQTEIEGPLNRDQIFGLVTAVNRKGRLLRPGDFWWEFFARVWPRIIPLRGIISRIYSKLF
jgi:hypothetical protein